MKVKIGNYQKNPSKDRKISVEIDDWDTFSLDHTLALIIHPALIKFKEKENGHPSGLSEKEWHDILDCMIFSFGKKLNDDDGMVCNDIEQTKKNIAEIQKGFDYFGKYYQNLWW